MGSTQSPSTSMATWAGWPHPSASMAEAVGVPKGRWAGHFCGQACLVQIPELGQEGVLGNSLRTAVAVHTTPDFHMTCPFLFFLPGVILAVPWLLSIALELKKETKKKERLYLDSEGSLGMAFQSPG